MIFLIQVFLRRQMQISLRFRHCLHHCVTLVGGGWSGALPNRSQSIPTLEDVRGAICQMRYPEGNKEKIDDHPLFVSPCVLLTLVYMMQECDIN